MGIASFSGASSVIKPGVVTSSTRPSSPFVGQLIYETDTARVAAYNGSAWITQNGGLVPLVGQTAFTATTGVTVSNVFSSTYSNYLLTVVTTATGADDLLMQFTVGGTATTANYNFQVLAADGTSVAGGRSTAASSALINRTSNATYPQVVNVNIFNPNVADVTMFQAFGLNQQSATTPYIVMRSGNQSASTQFDGFKLLSANNITGYYTLYGYTK